MSFCELRIKNDLDNLVIPIGSAVLDQLKLSFSLVTNSEIYNGRFAFTLSFPEDYPFASPRLVCHTPIFHPNIDERGRVCLKVLREGWMPSYTISSIVVSLIDIFDDPSSIDALNTEAGLLLDGDREAFKKKAQGAY